MIMQNWEIYVSIVFVLLTKIISVAVHKRRLSMFNKSGTVLTSIPEKNEEEEVKKWVPKKKHEVLKAKYKCLKKLFQIYDASVIGILPETCETEGDEYEAASRSHRSRRKHSHRAKSDACAGTTVATSEDVTDNEENDKVSTAATALIRDLKLPQHSCTSTQFDAATSTSYSKLDRYATTENSKSNITDHDFRGSEITQTDCLNRTNLSKFPHPVPYLMIKEKPKLTRFQCFIQRLFGIRRERSYKNLMHGIGHVYAASDNNITPHYYEKRRRRGLRFRKLRKPKKVQSDSAVNVKSPMILTYVQSVQKNCLMDTTPRQCPILGCRMIFYGIINYNDHLNLCHFTDRKYICHYCHEGFEGEAEKYIHENEHIGISKLSLPNISSNKQRVASVTQTDPELTKSEIPEDKLKKIISFFDKLANPDLIFSEIKNNRYSESNLHSIHRSKGDCTTDNASNSETDKKTISCVSLHRSKLKKLHTDSRVTSKRSYDNGQVTCQLCGELFDYRRQLSLHVDLEHRVHDKFSKFHSCAGIINARSHCSQITEHGKIDFKSEEKKDKIDNLRRKSAESLTYDPSTNIVYYTSMESVNSKTPVGYKWEPGTKIIRV